MSSGKLCVRTRLNDGDDDDYDEEHTFPHCLYVCTCVRNFEMEKLSVVGYVCVGSAGFGVRFVCCVSVCVCVCVCLCLYLACFSSLQSLLANKLTN